jgi:hypothetical protein
MNRMILALIGALLIAAGTMGLLAFTGVVSPQEPSSVYERLTTAVQERPILWWSVIIAGLVLVVVLALWWALRQLIVRRPGGALRTLDLDTSARGRTTVEATAVAGAAAADLRRLPQVTASNARVIPHGRKWSVRTRLDVVADADVPAVREATGEVYGRVAEALGVTDLPTHTRLRPRGDAPRVR